MKSKAAATNQRKLAVLSEIGFDIGADSDQPGLFAWTCGREGCESSFHSEREAIDDAWRVAISEVMDDNDLSDQEWGDMPFAQQCETLLIGHLMQQDSADIEGEINKRDPSANCEYCSESAIWYMHGEPRDIPSYLREIHFFDDKPAANKPHVR